MEAAARPGRSGLRVVGIVLGALCILAAIFLLYVLYLGVTTPLCEDAAPGEKCLRDSSTGRTLNVVFAAAGAISALLVLPLALTAGRRGRNGPWLAALAATVVLTVLVFIL